ncbi:MAG: glutathione S-transferase family protein [Burkholderiales bacterium]|nr:glutathione S-transferase family protein [Burkholderiales bacterium]
MFKQLIFYTNPMSRARIVRWMLEEINVPYETKILNYGTTMKDPEYLAINPMGKVPAIQHGNIVVTETAAICAYLAEAFPEAKLMPINDEERALYYRWLFFAAGPVVEALDIKNINPIITPKLQRSLGCGNPHDTFDVLAKAVSKSTYIVGDRFTAADVYIASYISFCIYTGELEKLPEFVAYCDRTCNRPARLRAIEIDGAL